MYSPSLRFRIFGAFFTLLASFVLVELTLFLSLVHLNGYRELSAQTLDPVVSAVAEVRDAFLDKTRLMISPEDKYSMTKQDANWRRADEKFQIGLGNLRQKQRTSPVIAFFFSKNTIDRIERVNDTLNQERDTLFNVANLAQGSEEARMASIARISSSLQESQSYLQDAESVIAALEKRISGEFADDIGETKTFVLVLLLVYALFGSILVFVVVYLIREPITEMMKTAKAIQEGDLSRRILIVSQDELGSLGMSFNAMVKSLQSTIQGREKTIEERTREIQKEKEKLEKVVKGIGVGLVTMNNKMEITWANEIFQEWFGRMGDIQGKNAAALYKFDDPESQSAAFRSLKSGLGERGEPFVFFVGKARKYFQLTTTPSLDKTGHIVQLIELVQDVTEQIVSQERIRSLNDLRNKFIQIVSHQLRTPLNAIRWNLEALLSDEMGSLKTEQKEFVRITHQADVEVIHRVHDLLVAMDIEEGRSAISKETVAVDSLLDSVVAALHARCKAKEISCKYEREAIPLPAIEADPNKIREVLEKLIDNAISYTSDKGSISASFKKVGNNLRFEITDSGIGIPRAEQGRIFSIFFRASNAQSMKQDASGLGLYIAKNYVEQHGGKIGFTSEEGKGSSFWFELPIRNGRNRADTSGKSSENT